MMKKSVCKFELKSDVVKDKVPWWPKFMIHFALVVYVILFTALLIFSSLISYPEKTLLSARVVSIDLEKKIIYIRITSSLQKKEGEQGMRAEIETNASVLKNQCLVDGNFFLDGCPTENSCNGRLYMSGQSLKGYDRVKEYLFKSDIRLLVWRHKTVFQRVFDFKIKK